MTKQLTEVYESGVAVVESVTDERARLTAEVIDLERQYEPVRTVQFPVLSAPGTSYGPLKHKLGLKIEIAERRARLSEIALAEAQADAARVKAETDSRGRSDRGTGG